MGAQLEKDRKTLEAIGRIYCRGNHDAPTDAEGLCAECRETVDVTLGRTAVCPYGHAGNCQDCDIHCQRGDAQRRIREMMRMAFRHPIMTAEYLRKKFRAGR